jgi:general secretion pathway protein N
MMNPQTARMLTWGLAGLCGLLLLVAIAQQFGVGRGYHWSAGGEAAPDDLPSAAGIQQDVAALGPETQYRAVQERPLLNEDRKPTPVDDSDPNAGVAPQVPLNVTLTGVIITPDVKLAMLRDNAKGDALSLREGMPLPGDQSVWTVVEILARKVVLKSANNETNELPLDVAAVTSPASTPTGPRMPTPPPPGTPPQVNVPPPMAVADPNAAVNAQNDRAAELQKRIEERRREMREQAERLRQQQANPQDQQKQQESE